MDDITENKLPHSASLPEGNMSQEKLTKRSTPPPDALRQAMQGGIVFKGRKLRGPVEEKVKTKAKKKNYITGAHGSGAARKKADIRTRRANRHKK